ERFAEEPGALQIHAFNQEETLVGQGTLGLEIEADLPRIDTLLVAVGGGGLIGGIAAWFAGRSRIIAVEPEGAPTLHRAFEAGHPVDAPAEGIAADSLAPKRVGEMMFPIAEAYVERSILVGDDDIVAAQKALWNRTRIISEPGGAAAFAAILSGRYAPAQGERLAVLVCGANADPATF
ncbi:pyridoxal-phosphate dependent enzyme, partial [Mesorhizobium sp. M7A.F.Ca.CA.002.15.2.1]|uniref:pyridoxal-phosphate dependent enzyme n=1 Tax=Mesorhizobium sp. M7A.F.Ca.CA.002.15.2.1 TaxID=2496678 RepID=UPI000FCCC8DE